MAYNNQITRTYADALIPEEVSATIIQEVTQQSVIMRMARRLPPISRQKLRMPVLSGLVTAYFLDGDTSRKQTADMQWVNKFIEAAELAVLVPIPEAVLDDADYDIWGEVRPRIVEAFGRAFDQAVLYGVNAPSVWPTAVLGAATAAGHAVTIGTGADIYDDIMGEAGLLAKVEEDGYSVTGHVAALPLRAKLRGLRDNNGNPIFVYNVQANTQYELDGVPLDFPRNGSILPAEGWMFSGDWPQLVYAMRQDITYKVLDQAVIQDNTGAIVYNLAQQDMVALRAVMRLGWQLPNPVNSVNPNSATRYPFSVLLPAGA